MIASSACSEQTSVNAAIMTHRAGEASFKVTHHLNDAEVMSHQCGILRFFGKYPAMGVTLYRWSDMA